MTKSELLSTFKEYLNTEVRSIIKEEIKHTLKELILETKKNNGVITSTQKVSTVKPITQTVQTPKKFVEKQYVKDPFLNKLLNETAMSSQPIDHDDYSDWPSMNTDSISPQGYVNSPALTKMVPPGTPDFMKKVLTRDYSELITNYEQQRNGYPVDHPGSYKTAPPPRPIQPMVAPIPEYVDPVAAVTNTGRVAIPGGFNNLSFDEYEPEE